MVYSPNQKWIACKIAYDVVKVLDASNGKEIHRFRAHGSKKIQGEVWSFAFSPDSKQLVSGGEDKTVKLWDVLTGKEIRTFSGHTAMVAGVAFTRRRQRDSQRQSGQNVEGLGPLDR